MREELTRRDILYQAFESVWPKACVEYGMSEFMAGRMFTFAFNVFCIPYEIDGLFCSDKLCSEWESISSILKLDIKDLHEYKRELVRKYVEEHNILHVLCGDTEYFCLPEETYEN
jgi:hypothetical protein